MLRPTLIAFALLALSGCDLFASMRGKPTSVDSNAIGAACRHVGRSLEECYSLNPEASKAEVFAGWKEMHDYMDEKKLATMAPSGGAQAVKDPHAVEQEEAEAESAEAANEEGEKHSAEDEPKENPVADAEAAAPADSNDRHAVAGGDATGKAEKH
jgi:hypothetical protein